MTPFVFVGLTRVKKEAFMKGRYLIRETVILKSICLHLRIALGDMKSQSRKPELVAGRHIAAGLLKEHTKLNLTEIGLLIGRDHSTVVYSIKMYEQRMEVDKKFRGVVEKIKAKLCMNTDT